MKPFTKADVETAFRELQPHIQQLVDRFGPAQAHHMRDGGYRGTSRRRQTPPIYISVGRKVVGGAKTIEGPGSYTHALQAHLRYRRVLKAMITPA